MKNYYLSVSLLVFFIFKLNGAPIKNHVSYSSFLIQDNEYCIPEYLSPLYFITQITTNGGIENIDYNTTSQPEEGYENITGDQSLVSVPGGNFDLTTMFQGVGHTVKIWIDWDNNHEFSEEEKVFDLYDIQPSKTANISIPNYVSEGFYRMRVTSYYGNSTDGPCGTFDEGSAIDIDIEIVNPACYPAQNITFNVNDDLELEVNWEGQEEVNQWKVEYGGLTIEPGEGTVVTTSESEFILENPILDMDYKFMITAECDSEDSPTVSADYFYGYCKPFYTTDFFYLTTVNTEGGIENIDYLTDEQPRDGYDNLSSSMTLITNPGDDITINTEYFIANFVLKVWVDWNRDLIFQDDEVVAEGEDMNEQEYVITIPEDAEPGTYRMRVGSRDNAPLDACGLYAYGSTLDFSLVIPYPECIQPTDLITEYITDNSATISWSPGGEEEMWEVMYGVEGFDLNNPEATLQVQTTEALLTNLSSNTLYDFYVRAICHEENLSDWAEGEGFTTEPVICSPPENIYIEEVSDTSAKVSWDDTEEENTWMIVYGILGLDFDELEIVITQENEYILTELVPETNYDVYVRAICNEEEEVFSDYIGPVNFTTDVLSMEKHDKISVKLFPNPAINEITLNADEIINGITIYNLAGKKVKNINSDKMEVRLDLQGLSPGVYFIKVNMNDKSQVFKFVKN